MKKKILIAPNSYKECADSVMAANYFADELDKFESVEKILLPLSDGGDGFLNVCSKYYNLRILNYNISTPYDDTTLPCRVGYDCINETIYIESADIIGLKIMPQQKRHPMYLSSKGMGDLFQSIQSDVIQQKLKVRKIIIGIGGTGTNDLGLGLLENFGLKLIDKNGKYLKVIPKNYEKVEDIYWSNKGFPFRIEMISDVDNPLLGSKGATFVFGKQKGLTDEEVIIAENGFNKIINLLYSNNILDPSEELSGAGGGLPISLKILSRAKLKSSGEFISEILQSVDCKNLDLIITGEGAFDIQSVNQKATGYLMDIFAEFNKPIIVCCGKFDGSISGKLRGNVIVIELSKYFQNEDDSIKNFRKGIHLAVEEIVERFLN